MRLIHQGRLASVFVEDGCVTKKYHNEGADSDTAEVFRNELSRVEKLQQIDNQLVCTPDILHVDEEELSWKQTYREGRSFYEGLIKGSHSVHQDMETTLYSFGVFLAKFHNRFGKSADHVHLHGDLSAHNMMFLGDGRLFVYDPGIIDGPIYVDIAKFLNNFHLINPLLLLRISREHLDRLKDAFLRGYKETTEFSFNCGKLKSAVLKDLEDRRHQHKNSILYRLRLYIMNYLNRRVYQQIKRGKINLCCSEKA